MIWISSTLRYLHCQCPHLRLCYCTPTNPRRFSQTGHHIEEERRYRWEWKGHDVATGTREDGGPLALGVRVQCEPGGMVLRKASAAIPAEVPYEICGIKACSNMISSGKDIGCRRLRASCKSQSSIGFRVVSWARALRWMQKCSKSAALAPSSVVESSLTVGYMKNPCQLSMSYHHIPSKTSNTTR